MQSQTKKKKPAMKRKASDQPQTPLLKTKLGARKRKASANKSDTLPSHLQQPKPLTFDEAFDWFVQFAPRCYLHQLDHACGQGVIQTRGRMLIAEVRTRWIQHKYLFKTLRQRCLLLFLIQSVYIKLYREHMGWQQNVMCNHHIGWEAAIVHTMEDIPVTITLQRPGYQTETCNVPLQYDFVPLYSYRICVRLHHLLACDLSPDAKVFFDKDVHFSDLEEQCYEKCQVFRKPYHSQFGGPWAQKRYNTYCKNFDANEKAPGCLITMSLLQDFIAHNVCQVTRQVLQNILIAPLIAIVTSFISEEEESQK